MSENDLNDEINFRTGDTVLNVADDTISFGAAQPVHFDLFDVGKDCITIPGATGNDVITFDSDMTVNKHPNRYKYSEDEILKELQDYISGTYNQHYSAGDDKIQTLDLIEACGDGEAFCRSNILKYASRYDKTGTARRDMMKISRSSVLTNTTFPDIIGGG